MSLLSFPDILLHFNSKISSDYGRLSSIYRCSYLFFLVVVCHTLVSFFVSTGSSYLKCTEVEICFCVSTIIFIMILCLLSGYHQ